MIKTNIIKKITALSVSCTLSVALLAGCGNSDNSQKDTTAKVSDKKSETATPTPDTSSPVSDVPAKKVYTVKSYNVYNEKNTLDHYYNFDYENNKLKKIEGYDKEGLGITYKAEIDANDNLTSFSSFNAKGAKSDYYKMILFDNGMLKCEHRYSPTDEELYKYDYTYNDNKQIDTKTGYSNGTKESGKSGYTYDQKGNLIQQTNYSVKGNASSYVRYKYHKGRIISEKYSSKEGKIYYVYKYGYNKKGQLISITNYDNKKCKKPVSITKYKYNKKGLKTDEYRYDPKNKLEKHINIKYTSIKVHNDNFWYGDWVLNHISE